MREFELLSTIFAKNDRLGSEVVIGPGDDMGMVRLVSGAEILVGVDQVVEGRHFESGRYPWGRIGRKAVARSLSDVAAMAAKPVACTATAVLPAGFEDDDAKELVEGMRLCGEAFGCPLIGGDVASGEKGMSVVCTVTVLAEQADSGRVVTRSGGKVGDGVYVTGVLGGGWRTEHHLEFEPRIQLALELLDRLGDNLHALIDISDGLGRDLDHVAECSGTGAEIEAARVPVRSGFEFVHAMEDGEDYELCFAVDGEADVPSELAGVGITQVGRLTKADGAIRTAILNEDGRREDASQMGWEHGG